jgi:hypothetical protein
MRAGLVEARRRWRSTSRALSLAKRSIVPFDKLRAHEAQAQGTGEASSGHWRSELRAHEAQAQGTVAHL